MHLVLNDLRFALRQLRQQPSFTIVATLSLALAIGANGLVYGVVDNLVFNPFQFPEPDRLVSVGSTFLRLESGEGFIEQHSPAEIDDFREAATLTHLAAFDMGNRAVSNGAVSTRVFTALIVDDPLPALGRPPVLGRGFTDDELRPGGPKVAILSHRLWTTMFGRDPGIIGSAIRMNGEPRTVVGVTAEGPTLLGTDLWIPWGGETREWPRNRRQFTLIARLAPGATIEQADAELALIAARTAVEHGARFPEYEGWRLRVAPWTEALTGQVRGPATLLLVAGIFVLLIACANLTGLMLARLNVRRREIAVRYALGAGGVQVIRLLLAESLIIATAATGLGLLLARAALAQVPSLLPSQVISLGAAPELDLRVVVYCAAVALLAAVLTTVVPAWQSRRQAPQDTLRAGGTSTGGRQRMRSTLVVAELSLAIVLLIGAGLLLRSFSRIQQIDPGFDPANILTMRLTLAAERYDAADTKRFFGELVDRLRAQPDVSAAAATAQLPPQLSFTTQFRVVGAPAETDTLPRAFFTSMTPGLFDVWGIPMRHGRALSVADRADAARVAVVNETFMRRYLGGRPEGHLLIGSAEGPTEVVGIVADQRNDTLMRPAQPEIFIPVEQTIYNNQLFLVVRTRTDPYSALPSVRAAIAELDPDQPPYLIQTMEEAMAGSVSQQRISLALAGTFAVIAVLVAGIGVYGVVAYWVSARSREIGIRLALGATRRQVAELVVGQTARLIAIGAVVGLAGGIAAGRAAESMLFETRAADPVVLAGVTVLLMVFGLLASYLPLRRAMGIDPATTLRVE